MPDCKPHASPHCELPEIAGVPGDAGSNCGQGRLAGIERWAQAVLASRLRRVNSGCESTFLGLSASYIMPDGKPHASPHCELPEIAGVPGDVGLNCGQERLAGIDYRQSARARPLQEG
jgi:hypothetical protein